MAISEQKLKELAAIEPPVFLERIADFLADLTLRTSALAVFERTQESEPIGAAGRTAQSFGERIGARAAITKGQRSLDWLYDLLKPYQIGPYELRQFSMWLVRWHDKLAETEVIREGPAPSYVLPVARPYAAAAGIATVDAFARGGGAARSGADIVAAEGGSRRRVVVRTVSDGAPEVVEEVVAGPNGPRRIRVVRRPGVAGSERVESSEVVTEPGVPAPSVARREPDVLSRAWRGAHGTPGSSAQRVGAGAPHGAGPEGAPGVGRADDLAPAGTRRALTKALWLSNLTMAGAAAGFMLGKSAQTGAIASRLAAPGVLGVAGPSTTPMMQAPGLAFPLSHPPVSSASWLGVAAPAPEFASFVSGPGGPPAFAVPALVPSATLPEPGVTMPVVTPTAQTPPVQPAEAALVAHRGAVAGAFAAARSGGGQAESPGRGAVGEPVAVVMGDGSVHPLPVHPSRAPSHRASPIPGLLAAGLAGYLLGRLTAGSADRPEQTDDLYVEPIHGAARPQRARIYSRSTPGTLTAIMVEPGAGPGPGTAQTPFGRRADALFLGVGLPLIGTGPSLRRPDGSVGPGRWEAGATAAGLVGAADGAAGPATVPVVGGSASAGSLPNGRDIFVGGVPVAGRDRLVARPSIATQGPKAPLDPRLGEVTVVAPPMLVASEQSERRGSAVAFDWPVLARGAGELDAAGLKRLQQVLPPGAQAIYPALPKGALPANAVNLRLAPSLLRPLLSQAYGSEAAGIAGSAAAMASGAATTMPANLPSLGRIVPAARPVGAGAGVLGQDSKGPAGALLDAGAGQARRSPMLDFLGVPIRLAPSLGGRAELRDELAARGVSDQGTAPTAVRPHVFGALRQQLFPGLQTVHAEPDKSAWRKAAPQFGMRDAEPATVLSPDSRIKPIGAQGPTPQLGGDRPSGGATPWTATPQGLRPFATLSASRAGAPLSVGSGVGATPLEAPSGALHTGERGTEDGHRWSSSARGLEPGPGLPSTGPGPDGAFEDGPPGGLRARDDTPEMRMPGQGGLRLPSHADVRVSRGSNPPSATGPGLRRMHAMPEHDESADDGIRATVVRPQGASGVAPSLGGGWPRTPRLGADGPNWRAPSTARAETSESPTVPRLGAGSLPDRFASAIAADRSWAPSGLGAALAPSGERRGGEASHAGPPDRLPDGLRTPLPKPQRPPALDPTVMGHGSLDRMGLGSLRRSPDPRGDAEAGPLVGMAPLPFGVPTPVPTPMPILASVAGPGRGADAGSRSAVGAGTGGSRQVEPHGRFGPLTITAPVQPGSILPVAAPVGIPLPLPMLGGSPLADGVAGGPDMALPPLGGASGSGSPTRTSTTIASRAPERVYAAVDSGPASKGVMVQRATSISAGMAGGPNVPQPSPHRAQRVAADTQRASVLASREDGMNANEVHLLANDVWSILRRRLALEADRRGKW